MRGESLQTLVGLQRPSSVGVHRRGVFRLLGLGFTIAVGAALAAACGKGGSAPPPPAPAAAPVKKAETAGVGIYHAALATEDSEEALHLLEQAVRANPRLAEAWYDVGRRKLKLAPDIVKLDELRGTQVFREGLEAEKEALRLLDAGKVTIWNAAEEDQARATLATDLANVDETLADQESSLRALRVRTY
jgi:tetratricopeptide (TPR) repeat protein